MLFFRDSTAIPTIKPFIKSSKKSLVVSLNLPSVKIPLFDIKTKTFLKYSNDTSFTDRIVEMAEMLDERQEESIQFINLLERDQRKKKEQFKIFVRN